MDFQKALIEKSISFESHIYAYGQHGFSTGEPNLNSGKLCSRVPSWVKDSIEWLEDVMGQLTPNGMTEPACPGKLNGNHEEFLSMECTIAHLMNQSAQVQELLAGIYQKVNAAFVALLGHTEGINPLLKMMTIGRFMKSIGIPAEEIERLDKSLHLIPNQIK